MSDTPEVSPVGPRPRSLWRRMRRRISNFQVLLYPPIVAFIRATVWIVQKGVTYDRRGPLYDYIRDKKPCILVFWHQDPFPAFYDLIAVMRDYPTAVMISGGRVGNLTEAILDGIGLGNVRGSRKHGIAAIDELTRRMKDEGVSTMITADGSRGPAFKMKWGPIYLARDTGMPLIGVRGWGDNLIMFKRTWMKLVISKPWGRGLVLTAEPLFVPPDADKETLEIFRQKMEHRLNALVRQSLAEFGTDPDTVDWAPKLPDGDGEPATASPAAEPQSTP